MADALNLNLVKSAHASFLRKQSVLLDLELKAAAKFAEDYVQAHPTFQPRTGKLQAATKTKVIRNSRGGLVRIKNTAKYAKYVEYGTKPHWIRARRAKALRFVSRGKLMFRKRVWHPGTRPYKFLYRAANAAGRIFQQGMQAKMARIAQTF